MAPVLIATYEGQTGIISFMLNRPDARNALTEELVDELTRAIVAAARDSNIRAIIISGAGEHFCGGTDIEWISHCLDNRAEGDARRIANLLLQIRNCAKPVIARVNGMATGTGVGLVAAADIAVSDEDAVFSLPAVKLGILPAIMGPFLTEAMGPRQARRYLLTGENFSAMDARRVGLVHAVCIRAHLDDTIAKLTTEIGEGGPDAIHETKALLNNFGEAPPSPGILKEAAKVSVRLMQTDEAREGVAAYLEGRPPKWRLTK